ncbi:stage V sporulation protein K [Paenibacillus sp. UNCCL117]|uniref:AAA family ATPase n=1 Tax=unclassified Paenibacillus TaxID=185978 RepID=UPI000884291F|nr:MULTISPECIES: AAA family ATPase [unclassified Paenibacillus]SDC46046.1 stage V sporulation protein K [Paenibacillus sp. cl123]SFW12378.1 stage V sporulation protein K [Paenibacillus sp. UNCCL117]
MSEDTRLITKRNRQINVVFKPSEAEQAIEKAEVRQLVHDTDTFSDIFRELDEMIGLEDVKELVFQVYAMLQVKKFRDEAGLQTGSQVYHMIFKGNPGTGKTTVARILGKMFKSMGFLSKGHMIEVERADLVGEYIGHTALKTRELVKKALGGVLFIDEAYSLARGGDKDFGKEAIDCLVKSMEDYKNDFILILAGYPTEIENFLLTNPGLPSRFPIQVEFPDYTVQQLIKIANKLAVEKDYVITSDGIIKIRERLNQEVFSLNFSNARFVRNLIEKAIRHQAVRIVRKSAPPTKQDLINLISEDFVMDEEIQASKLDKFSKFA